ncbi:uncharacterized protein CLUP02_17084 [Colletotrichum lupini]|uniref:Uncharacterized protein n=1 Tax=Colletotrichum lupini TaxID=145971 RepID=A0A9Q8T9M2_9PEZI|nr:uncharacterized protein CLUP02_17084 [Colletotrichum lupini]UQC91548.1 hypothetical protein CLUP02_17084 [Colletotrichum lupini]
MQRPRGRGNQRRKPKRWLGLGLWFELLSGAAYTAIHHHHQRQHQPLDATQTPEFPTWLAFTLSEALLRVTAPLQCVLVQWNANHIAPFGSGLIHPSSHRGLRGKTIEETEIRTRNAVLPSFFSPSELDPESVKLPVDYSSVLVVFGSWKLEVEEKDRSPAAPKCWLQPKSDQSQDTCLSLGAWPCVIRSCIHPYNA